MLLSFTESLSLVNSIDSEGRKSRLGSQESEGSRERHVLATHRGLDRQDRRLRSEHLVENFSWKRAEQSDPVIARPETCILDRRA